MTGPTSARFHVTRAQGDLLLPAASRLAEASSGLEGAGEQLLAAARLHAISFRYFWASTPGPGLRDVRQACLIVPGAGRTGMCFTTRPRTPEEEAELGAVIDHACSALSPRVVRLAQALLDVGDAPLQRSHELGGLRTITTLRYLRRDMPDARDGLPTRPLPEGISIVPYRPGHDEQALLEVVPRTYEGTLDCPELSAVRRPADVIASHRAAGNWSPEHWSIIRERDRSEGVVLFNPMPDQDAMELVYYGITPALRGRGLGQLLLEHALRALVGRPERRVTCACDARNTPALRVYEALGMGETERRLALVRVVGASAS